MQRPLVRLLLLTLGLLGGCITADMKLEADGSGTLEAKFDPVLPSTAGEERRLFEGPDVTVEAVEVGEGRTGLTGAIAPEWVRVRVAFMDATKLSLVRRLERFKVELTDAGEDKKRLTVSIKPQTHGKGFEHKEPVTIRVHFPGEVVESSARVEGRMVIWSFPAAEFVGASGLSMHATYTVAPPAKGGAVATPPAAAPAGTPPSTHAAPGTPPAKGAPGTPPAEASPAPPGA